MPGSWRKAVKDFVRRVERQTKFCSTTICPLLAAVKAKAKAKAKPESGSKSEPDKLQNILLYVSRGEEQAN